MNPEEYGDSNPGPGPGPVEPPTKRVPIIKQRIHTNIIIKNIIQKSEGSSSYSSYSFSGACFDAIKIALLGKIKRGQNHEIDQFIDNCLGVKLVIG